MRVSFSPDRIRPEMLLPVAQHLLEVWSNKSMSTAEGPDSVPAPQSASRRLLIGCICCADPGTTQRSTVWRVCRL
ncbi:hypothetical protein EXIGLDRAFT_733996 [Exidia glandulosa HHB12029]|uniref:Uncharacterized protein n=1 Tax=Exidia glandulosa HHB12029 TaxID=1314781 RepID=A0A165B691_EXIGL|nr:hypothetical protein EXIGLDRAFT_733996 [Exidia glandulosa HHB12029]